MVDQVVKESILQFSPLQSVVDEGFWHRLSSLKLNKLGIDQSPIPITVFFSPCSHNQVSNHLTLLGESLPSESSEQSFTQQLVVETGIDVLYWAFFTIQIHWRASRLLKTEPNWGRSEKDLGRIQGSRRTSAFF